MRTSILFAFLVAAINTLTAQPDPSRSAGFKQFHLGMTHAQVNQIIRTTPWVYVEHDTLGPKADRFAGILHVNVEGRKGDGIDGLDSLHRSLITVGCSTGPDTAGGCKYASAINLDFIHDTLFSIEVHSSDEPGANAIAAKRWGDVATSWLESRYGKHGSYDRYLAKLNTGDLPSMQPGLFTISDWHLPKDVYGSDQAIKVFLYKAPPGTSTRPVHAFIVIADQKLSAEAE